MEFYLFPPKHEEKKKKRVKKRVTPQARETTLTYPGIRLWLAYVENELETPQKEGKDHLERFALASQWSFSG